MGKDKFLDKIKIDILIVEDSPTHAQQLKYLLEKNNYNVIIAENGLRALDLLVQFDPSMIITDICMPFMDGYELCRRVKEQDSQKEIPVILLTSLSNPEDVIEGLECGADNFITKPYADDYLLSHVEHIIANRKIYKSERVRIGVEIMFAGKRRFITANQLQMLTLLISTYEAAVMKNKELILMQEELQTMNDQLEEMVEERTKELLKAKEKAEESDKLKSAFLANMSHEIRTPMNGILGVSQLLKDENISQEKKERFIEAIDISTHQLLHIITDIVDISKIESGQETTHPRVFNLNNLIGEVYNFFQPQAAQKSLKLVLNKNIPSWLVDITSDSIKLGQILNNLIGNALKFTEKGTVEINVTTTNDRLIFRIRDTGIGIDPSLQEAVFDRFRQVELTQSRKYDGTGLGLSLAKSYVEMLGGTIYVDSIPNVGSTFTFEIPLVVTNVQLSESKEETKEVSYLHTWNGKTMLLAEDEEVNSFYIETVLKSTGINIITAQNGLEAVEHCKKNNEISLILMDIKMPEMDGLTATRIIKSFNNSMPIIATTAYALSSDKEKCIEAGCNDYLSKPIRKDQLITMMNKYIS